MDGGLIMNEHFDKAIQYVKEKHTWSDACVQHALEIIEECRCPIDQASDEISYEIHDLMEEYGQDNDLPEGWWYQYGDEDDVFWELLK